MTTIAMPLRGLGKDWTKQNSPPIPPNRKFGGAKNPPGSGIPELPVRMVMVKAVEPAIVYNFEGVAIPWDDFVAQPISPTIMMAVRAGDLEMQPPEAETKPAQYRDLDRRRD